MIKKTRRNLLFGASIAQAWYTQKPFNRYPSSRHRPSPENPTFVPAKREKAPAHCSRMVRVPSDQGGKNSSFFHERLISGVPPISRLFRQSLHTGHSSGP